MKIGKRMLKTSLAVFLCIIISSFMNVNPFYACIAAVISMESTFTNSYRSGLNRMLGTILGALVGLVMSLLNPENPFLAAIGVIIIIYVCNYFKWNKSIVIGCTVFFVIMTNLQGRQPVTYSIFRALDTLFGIVVAIGVNRFVFPPRIWEKFNMEYNEVNYNINILCKGVLLNGDKVDTKPLKNMCRNLTSDLNLYKDEKGYFKKVDEERFDCYHEFIKNVNEIILYIDILNEFEGSRVLNEDNLEKICKIYEKEAALEEKEKVLKQEGIKEIVEVECEGKVAEDETSEDKAIFNYHISKIVRYLNKINI